MCDGIPDSICPSGGNPPGRGNGREGEPVANPWSIWCICMLSGENTRGVLCNTALPNIAGCTFCKRWHLCMSYFIGCVWATSHIHPSAVILDTVVAALTTERTAAAEAASIPEWRGRGAHVVPPLPSPPPPVRGRPRFQWKGWVGTTWFVDGQWW